MKGRISDSSLALLTIGSSRLAEASTDFVVVIKDAITKRDKWVSQNWPKTQTKKEISNWVGKNVETGEYVSSIAKEQRKMLQLYHWKGTRVHHDREYTRSVQKMLPVWVTLFMDIYRCLNMWHTAIFTVCNCKRTHVNELTNALCV